MSDEAHPSSINTPLPELGEGMGRGPLTRSAEKRPAPGWRRCRRLRALAPRLRAGRALQAYKIEARSIRYLSLDQRPGRKRRGGFKDGLSREKTRCLIHGRRIPKENAPAKSGMSHPARKRAGSYPDGSSLKQTRCLFFGRPIPNENASSGARTAHPAGGRPIRVSARPSPKKPSRSFSR